MKSKKICTIIAALIFTLTAATACGENSSESSSSAAQTTTTTAAAESSSQSDSSSTADESVAESEESSSADESSAADDTSSADSAETVGVSDIEILDADSGNTELSSGSATVTIGDKQVNLSGAYIVDGIDATITGGTYESTSSDQNVFLVINGGSLTLSNAEIKKSGDAGANDSERTSDVSDDYNFYGMNSIILVVGEDSSATIKDCKISSDCSGANAVFSTAGATAEVNNASISTTGNSSRGVYATYEGTINAENIEITTEGAHCAPIATDRGGGYVTVKNSKVSCSGDGSPCIYSTGNITVENVEGVSSGAQAAVIEGKNSITMTDCTFDVTGGNNGIMLYQSMSGDAADKDATDVNSTITIENTTINNGSEGAMFYITNTVSEINILSGSTFNSDCGEFLSAATSRWGNDGSNGGTVTVNVTDTQISDSITADDISSASIVLSGSAEVTGETSGSVTIS